MPQIYHNKRIIKKVLNNTKINMKFILFERELGHMINRIMQGYVAKLVTGRQMPVVNPSP